MLQSATFALPNQLSYFSHNSSSKQFYITSPAAPKASAFPTNLDSFSTDRKVMHVAWHPHENSLAIGSTNMLYIFSQEY